MQPVVVGDKAEQVQRGQVRHAGAACGGLLGGGFPGTAQPRAQIDCLEDTGLPLQEDRGVGPPDEPGDLSVALAAALHIPDECVERGGIRVAIPQRGAEGFVVVVVQFQSTAGPAGCLIPQFGDRVGDVAGKGAGDRGGVSRTSRISRPMVKSRSSPSGSRWAMPVMVLASPGVSGTLRCSCSHRPVSSWVTGSGW